MMFFYEDEGEGKFLATIFLPVLVPYIAPKALKWPYTGADCLTQ